MRRPAPNIGTRLARWILALAITMIVVPAPTSGAVSWVERPVAVAVASPVRESALPRVAQAAPVAAPPPQARPTVPMSGVAPAAPRQPVAFERRLYLLYQRLLC